MLCTPSIPGLWAVNPANTITHHSTQQGLKSSQGGLPLPLLLSHFPSSALAPLFLSPPPPLFLSSPPERSIIIPPLSPSLLTSFSSRAVYPSRLPQRKFFLRRPRSLFPGVSLLSSGCRNKTGRVECSSPAPTCGQRLLVDKQQSLMMQKVCFVLLLIFSVAKRKYTARKVEKRRLRFVTIGC